MPISIEDVRDLRRGDKTPAWPGSWNGLRPEASGTFIDDPLSNGAYHPPYDFKGRVRDFVETP